MKVDNAIILAAGTASRFAPLSYEKPKALIEVRGEILIERQIRQLREAGIKEIVIITGYISEQFEYLKKKYDITLIHNPHYLMRNNNSSIYVAKDYIRNSYICSSDNYFCSNPFKSYEKEAFYSAVYVNGKTKEWCISEDDGWIKDVKIGGQDSWVMLGHVFWSSSFSHSFLKILEEEYEWPETADKLWEAIYIEHINQLPMRIQKYPANYIFEFDTLDELRCFDKSYVSNTRSIILKRIAINLGVKEKIIKNIQVFKYKDNVAAGFIFEIEGKKYKYYYKSQNMEEIKIE